MQVRVREQSMGEKEISDGAGNIRCMYVYMYVCSVILTLRTVNTREFKEGIEDIVSCAKIHEVVGMNTE